jgi:hypothetical protein
VPHAGVGEAVTTGDYRRPRVTVEGAARMTRRVVAGVIVVALVLVPGLSQAAPPPPALVLTGSTSASSEITLKHDTTLDLRRMTASGSGHFAGLYLEPIDVPPSQREQVGRHSGAIAFRDVREPGGDAYLFPFVAAAPTATKAGRYRIYLFVDRPTVVRVPISGSASLHVRPTSQVVVAYASRPNILTSPLEARNVQPLRVTGRRSISMSAMIIGGFRAFAGDVGTCLRPPGSECGSATSRGADGPYTSLGVNPLADYGLAFRVSYLPGALTGGAYEAYQGALNAGGLKYASGAAFTFRLA